jgi:hypothetical protein
MSLVIVEVDGVHRNTPEELEPLKLAIQGVSASFRVAIVYPEERRYGGGPGMWPELLHVWLPEAGKFILGAIGKTVVDWAVKRIRARRDRRVTAYIYGPDGRVVKEIKVDEKLGVTENDPEGSGTPSRKRPRVDDD